MYEERYSKKISKDKQGFVASVAHRFGVYHRRLQLLLLSDVHTSC